jgi:hypothetical protein
MVESQSAMLHDMTSGGSAVEVITAIASPVVAVAAIAANLWVTRSTLDDRREERLWSDRAELYVDLVRVIRREQRQDSQELLMTIDTLDRVHETFWQSEQDRNPGAWDDMEVRVITYASDRIRNLYFEWNRALVRLAGVVQPEAVTGTPRPTDVASTVEDALSDVRATGSRLLEGIRLELRSDDSSRLRRRRIMPR